MDMMDLVKAGIGSLSGTAVSAGQTALLQAALSALGGGGRGLSGLIQAFQDQGLGDVIGSWIGTGQNQPISAGQIQQVLGSQQFARLAAQAGLTPDATGSMLASLLPTVIDRLTPDGQLPAGGELPGLDTLAKLLR